MRMRGPRLEVRTIVRTDAVSTASGTRDVYEVSPLRIVSFTGRSTGLYNARKPKQYQNFLPLSSFYFSSVSDCYAV